MYFTTSNQNKGDKMKNILLIPLILICWVFADEDYYKNSSGVAPVNDEVYMNECASCHFGFQAGLLPKRSWVKMMGGLEDHFGTDATVSKEDHEYLLTYLVDNAADNVSGYKRSRKMNASILPYDTPLKITEVPYFKKEHDEIPQRLITQKEVGSLSNCAACHTTAQKGVYSERAIKIPNYGRWDD